MINRVKKIIAENEFSSSKFADEIGVQRSSISHILSGRNKASLEFVQKILKRFPEINSDWLISGKGKMKSQQDSNLFSQEQNKKSVEISSVEEKTDSKKEVEIIELPKKRICEVLTKDIVSNQKITSSTKEIEKIIMFYTDKTFDVYKSILEK